MPFLPCVVARATHFGHHGCTSRATRCVRLCRHEQPRGSLFTCDSAWQWQCAACSPHPRQLCCPARVAQWPHGGQTGGTLAAPAANPMRAISCTTAPPHVGGRHLTRAGLRRGMRAMPPPVCAALTYVCGAQLSSNKLSCLDHTDPALPEGQLPPRP